MSDDRPPRQPVKLPPRAEYQPEFHRHPPGAVLHGLRLLYYIQRVTRSRRHGWDAVLGWFQCEICGNTFVARVRQVEDDRIACIDSECHQMHLAKLAR